MLILPQSLFVVYSQFDRIIGIQSFKGSLRRSCQLSPTLGETEISLSSQFCGGYIDPVSLNVTGYMQLNGENAKTPKGYICPLGQVCRVCRKYLRSSTVRLSDSLLGTEKPKQQHREFRHYFLCRTPSCGGCILQHSKIIISICASLC